MIQFDNVSKRYQKEAPLALNNVSFRIEQGEFVFLVGHSGSGKSTLLNLILRLERANAGDMNVLGYDLTTLSKRRVTKYRQLLGTVFQGYKLLPKKTAFENVSFALEILGKPTQIIKPAVESALELVGLSDLGDRMPFEMSGGEQQRVAIARAIVNKPKILLADEPTGNLDPTTGIEIMKVIEDLNKSGVTVLMATHNDLIVNQAKHRVIELVKGDLIRDEKDAKYDSSQNQTTHVPVTKKESEQNDEI